MGGGGGGYKERVARKTRGGERLERREAGCGEGGRYKERMAREIDGDKEERMRDGEEWRERREREREDEREREEREREREREMAWHWLICPSAHLSQSAWPELWPSAAISAVPFDGSAGHFEVC